jgi:SAM-dependent methyltransferase
MEAAVLRKVLPRRLKAIIKETIRREVESQLAAFSRGPEIDAGASRAEVQNQLAVLPPNAGIDLEAIRRDVEVDLCKRGYVKAIWPHQAGSHSYILPKNPGAGPDDCLFHESSPLPIPPKELWLNYGQTVEVFLELGREHVQALREMLEQSGMPIEAAGRILDFGCGTARMIRWLHDISDSCEIWGTEIRSSCIAWCKQYLSPPFHFATTTIAPHLPFEDRYFGLIYAGSVFTHLDDLAEAWLMELRRVLRPGGRLFITVHDHNTIRMIWDPESSCYPLFAYLRECPEFLDYCRSDFAMFTVGRSLDAQVFYDPEYLSRKLAPFYRTLSVGAGRHGFQTALVLERL